ncbi:MAG: hypothetical protein ACJAYU_001123 [Bradymonadia bacterium]|jgi:hypothetical protein
MLALLIVMGCGCSSSEEGAEAEDTTAADTTDTADTDTAEDATDTGGSDAGEGCAAGGDVPRSLVIHGPDGTVHEATVTADERCPASAAFEVEVDDATYTLLLAESGVEISIGANDPAIVATWSAGGGLTLESENGATVGHPLRPYLLLNASDIADFDSLALALLDWGSLSAILELTGADPQGNDPAEDATSLPVALRYLQLQPPVFRMEIGTLSAERGTAMVEAMDVLMGDPEVVDYHHFELCHIGESFFTQHDVFVDRMEAHLIEFTPALALPFGRMPFYEPGGQIPPAFQTWSAVADEFYAEHDACDPYPRRVCADELMYTTKFSDPDLLDTYPCDPQRRETWCEGLLQGLDCSDLLATTPDDYLGCEDGDADGLPDSCPYALLPRFNGSAICDYETIDDLWVEMIDWHGQTHDRIGGAHGDHAMTASTPAFWVYHVTINAVYDGYIRCP